VFEDYDLPINSPGFRGYCRQPGLVTVHTDNFWVFAARRTVQIMAAISVYMDDIFHLKFVDQCAKSGP